MKSKGGRWLAASLGAAAGAYAAYVGSTWLRHGHAKSAASTARDPLLDVFMPEFDVAEHHHADVAAPAEITLATAAEVDLPESGAVRAIFKGRELFMGATPGEHDRPRGLLASMKRLGWCVLAEIPGREIVMGGITRPWEADIVFRSVAPGAFAAFQEPDYVKIVWTLRADSTGPATSIARTETRVISTDAESRRKFRRYWSLASPGILLIRRSLLKRIKAHAEERARSQAASPLTSAVSRSMPASGGPTRS